MAAENDIIIKITSETDLDSAQRQLQELTKRAEELEIEMSQMQTAYEKEAAAIKRQNKSREEEAAELLKLKQRFRDIKSERKAEATAVKKSIKDLTDSIKAYKTLHGQTGRAVQQLRAMREALMQMEDAGEFGTQAFIDLSIAAGKLEDQISDTQQRIRILASDTKEMDAVMGLGDGLAGSFYIATSAAEIFGDDMEGLQQAFYKVQAAMSVVSGAQQVWNALNKDSAAMVVINTALTKLLGKAKSKSAVITAADAAASTADAGAKTAEAVATGAAAKAQWSLNAAFAANPIGFVLAGLAALAGAIFALYKMLDKSEQAARRARKAQEEYDKVNRVTSYNLNLYAKEHEKALRKIERSEADRLFSAKKRHASDIEMANIELDILKQRQKETSEYTNKAIKDNNEAQIAANKVYNERLKQLHTTRKGTKAYQDALDQLSEAERQMHDVWTTGNELIAERDAANDAVRDKELEIAELRISMEREAQQAIINNMREGKKKELAQLEFDYEEQRKAAKGNNKLLLELEAKYKKDKAEIDKNWENRANAAVVERLRLESEADKTDLDKKEKYYRADAEAKKQALDKMKMSEEEYKNAVTGIYNDLDENLRSLDEERANRLVQTYATAADKAAHAAEQAQGSGRLDALKDNLDAQLALYSAQQDQLKAQYDAGLISYQDYKAQEWEITKATTDAEVQYQQQAMQTIADGFSTALGYMQQISDLAFEAINNNIQAQMDALDKEYTTDWEEAQKNADKKYITEKEYEKKKAALEEKQAKYAKAQAIINAGISTALAVVTTLAQLGATPWGIAASVIAAAMGAAQIAVIASKPLAQYEKGRKGGKGEYALVGEKGPEIMYVPDGASIVPNRYIASPDKWAQYNVPAMPHADPEILQYVSEQGATGLTIDYDRIGASVANHLPRQRNVTVNVDRSGVQVQDGAGIHSYLNAKYTGSWR